MDSDPRRLVVFFIILSTNPKMLQMINILVTVSSSLYVDLCVSVEKPASVEYFG